MENKEYVLVPVEWLEKVSSGVKHLLADFPRFNPHSQTNRIKELESCLEMLVFCKSYKDTHGKFDGVYDKVAPTAWEKAKEILKTKNENK